jgi:hypothetical protein
MCLYLLQGCGSTELSAAYSDILEKLILREEGEIESLCYCSTGTTLLRCSCFLHMRITSEIGAA